MITQKAEYIRCDKCNHVTNEMTAQTTVCDMCESVLLNDDWLDLELFKKDDFEKAEGPDFCSWKCCFEYIAKKIDPRGLDFIELPFLTIRGDERVGCRYEDFLHEINNHTADSGEGG